MDIRQLNFQWIRSRLGLVGQEPILFDLTIAENITYGLENIPMSEIIDASIRANIHEFIQQLPEVSINCIKAIVFNMSIKGLRDTMWC